MEIGQRAAEAIILNDNFISFITFCYKKNRSTVLCLFLDFSYIFVFFSQSVVLELKAMMPMCFITMKRDAKMVFCHNNRCLACCSNICAGFC